MLTRAIKLLRAAFRVRPESIPAPVPVPMSRAIVWRTAVQARGDYGLPASAVPDLVRRALVAIESGQGEVEALVSLRRRARRMSRRNRPQPHRCGGAGPEVA